MRISDWSSDVCSSDLLAGPTAEIAEADGVIAMVPHGRRQQSGWEGETALLGKEQELLLGHGRVERRTLRLPVGNQLVQRARLQHRAGQDMGADLRALLDDADAEVLSVLGAKLLEANRRRQPGGTRDRKSTRLNSSH